MKLLTSLCVICGLLVGVTFVGAAELKSGVQPGDAINPFDVVKCAGPDDGVKIGDELCYRCKYGSRPMLMVFARKSDKSLAKLAKELDSAVKKNKEEKLAAFVNLLGENRDELEASAKELGGD